ncbi:MAG: LLM class flavin-dependent oxidoreductase [Alphaproteobacteria bacterium]|jgi:dimethylsulfone monooxygenase|nr:LLM class flavin-dependent oxidoreductase [Alphaproteobacteria bacterium]
MTHPHPINSGNAMKLGIMAFNCSGGSTVTTAPEAWPMTWSDNVKLAKLADDAGFEALLPVGRWKGYGGPSNFNNSTFESFTWAAGIAAVTERIAVCATIHAPLAHPVMAAKQAATIDHISGGRFVLNIVCGWFREEFEMFAAEWRDHDRRYEYAAEWLALARQAWTETEPFDFNGAFFTGQAIWSEPKPLQGGELQIMNAGSSPTGQRFSAENCDMNFVMLRQKDEASDRAQIGGLKTMAVNAGRKSQCWIHGYGVCRGTQAEADAYLHRYVEDFGDDEAVGNMLSIFGMESETLEPAVMDAFRFHFKAGHGGYPLVGTPAKIVDDMVRLRAMGVDGILLSWLDYLGEAQQWVDEVLPLMEAAGLRSPHSP